MRIYIFYDCCIFKSLMVASLAMPQPARGSNMTPDAFGKMRLSINEAQTSSYFVMCNYVVHLTLTLCSFYNKSHL